ncbi:MAG: AbrB/MazE/SpoVT family DNA-binding domain-containing protein [Elusimicrobia bacterium]|nr:AbrB/MazE/SpoVT family DNA-binding domain-containing protein [Elusimicrobiota bacterium]
MTQLVTATLSSKGQITLPKAAREVLGLKTAGELVGFLVDSEAHKVELTRLRVVPEAPDFTEEEYRKLLRLRKERGGKTFRSSKAFLDHLKKP